MSPVTRLHLIPDYLWHRLEWVSAGLLASGGVIAAGTAEQISSAYSILCLVGAFLGTAMALLLRADEERRRIVIARALGSLLTGCALPPVAELRWPWLKDFTAVPIILIGFGAFCALLGFTLTFAIFAVMMRQQRRVERVIEEQLTRRFGPDPASVQPPAAPTPVNPPTSGGPAA